MKFLHILFLCIVLALSIACSNIPLTSVSKLNAIDFKQTDLHQLGAVAKIPNAIDISKFEVVYSVEIETEDAKRDFTSILEQTSLDIAANSLIEQQKEEGYTLRAYKIPAGDITKLNAMREQARKWKAENGWAKGRAGIHARNFCFKSGQDHENLRGNLWVSAEETGGYILLLRNIDLSKSNLSDQSDINCD